MSTASAPNRFWGVVALALNSALQPAGQICGGTDSPALRLSPLFQIANALSLIYHSVSLSFATELPFRTAVGVVAERTGLYYNVTGPERRSYFRALVFVFGALPAFIKAMAIQGDRVSYWLALGFFVPYVVLELIERLAKEPSLARLAEATRMPEDKKRDVIIFGALTAVFALALHVTFCLETMRVALMNSIFEAKPFELNQFIVKFSGLAASVGPMSMKVYELSPKSSRSELVLLTIGIGSSILLFVTLQETIHMWGRWSEIATTILAIAIGITSTLAHLFVYIRWTSTTLRQFPIGDDRHKQKFMEQWTALWTVVFIFIYYGYLYDTSGTYKPAWTEWLP